MTPSCERKEGSDESTTYRSREAFKASSNVDLKLATKSCGSFLINPTVSEIKIFGRDSGNKGRIVVSKVAKSLSAIKTSLPVNARIKEDFPALV